MLKRPLKRRLQQPDEKRKGGIMVLAVFFLAGVLTFVGMSVDLGMINVTKSRMQTNADACALAAAQEIVAAIQYAGASGADVGDVHAFAEQQARAVAKDIAARNDFFLTDSDIEFGRRAWNVQNQAFETDWSGSPHNAVRVTVRKDGSDKTRGDSKLSLMFAPVLGDKTISMKTQAAAYVEARDFVTVLDYSGSMNYDSLTYRTGVSDSLVLDNLDDCWDKLVASNSYFSDDGSTKKFPTAGFGRINSYQGAYETGSAEDIFDDLELESELDDEGVRFYDLSNYRTFMMELGPGTYDLNTLPGNVDDDINSFRVPDGLSVTLWDFANEGGWRFGQRTSDVSSMGGFSNDAEWVVITRTGSATRSYEPYPQEGRHSNGNFRGKPSKSESKDHWLGYINWVRSNSSSLGSLKNRYGYRTLAMYMLEQKRRNDESEDLWRVPAYPFQAVKDGMTQFNTFLSDLSFGDTLGLVSYGSEARKMNTIMSSEVSAPNTVNDVDLGSTYMTSDYHKIEEIQLHHQAAHYTEATNIGDGVKNAREILEDEARAGARWQMLIMTDGVVNRPSNLPSGLPSGWNTFDWSKADWDGDGVADYGVTDLNKGNRPQKEYLLHQCFLAKEAGITLHTMAVGEGADRDLMRAIAAIGRGVYIEIAGDTTPAQMTTLLEQKFNLLAGNVPPAKLMFDE